LKRIADTHHWRSDVLTGKRPAAGKADVARREAHATLGAWLVNLEVVCQAEKLALRECQFARVFANVGNPVVKRLQ
jgi:hypothetical protein